MNPSAKVMLLGDIGVGKSSLARRLVFDHFETDYKTTIGVDVLTYDLTTTMGPLRLIRRPLHLSRLRDGNFTDPRKIKIIVYQFHTLRLPYLCSSVSICG